MEGEIDNNAISLLESGSIEISHKGKKHKVAKAKCKIIAASSIPERTPPIRFRKNIPTSWIELTITEGKNRQVRKMTAAAGFPTLRLVRFSIGGVNLSSMQPGDVVILDQINL